MRKDSEWVDRLNIAQNIFMGSPNVLGGDRSAAKNVRFWSSQVTQAPCWPQLAFKKMQASDCIFQPVEGTDFL